MSDDASYLLDTAQAATYLGTTVRHIRRLRKDHGLPTIKLGGKPRFLKADLDRFIASLRVNDSQRDGA